jgi:hypothetical protein
MCTLWLENGSSSEGLGGVSNPTTRLLNGSFLSKYKKLLSIMTDNLIMNATSLS